MKKVLLVLAVWLGIIGISNAQTITVLSPNSAENWAGCSSQTISWSQSGTSGKFNVEYSTNNGGTWAILASNYTGTSLSWTVPNVSSTQALVRVYDYTNNSITDQSNATFTITPALIVTAPNGNEIWQVGAGTRNITWQGYGTSNSFLLEYSINGGSSWTSIVSSSFTPSGNNYSYTWTLPNEPSSFCLVRITDNNSPACKTDNSDGVFTIAAPTPVITVTSPNGANTLYIDQSATIAWTSDYLSGNFVKIEYSTNSGSSWTTVINSTSNTGSYTWTNIPNTPSSTCLIKVSDAVTPTTYDVSDATFSIALGTLTVTYPNGGESFNGCQGYNITWTKTGTSNYFNIEYTTNGGASWSSIASNYYQGGATGSFSWAAPNVSSSQARVRIRDYNNAAIKDSSDANFTINPALMVTAPNGSEIWQGGTTQTITWAQGTGASNYWTIQYSTDGGNNWNTITTSSYITNGQYSWSVPNVPSTSCLIKVYDYYSSSCITDVSNNLFTITPATPVITVTSPNTNLTYYVGGSYTISWTYQYVSGSFAKIEYSTNNGSSWATVINSISMGSNGSGSYTWSNIPNTPSTQCLVRVSDFADALVKDSSNTTFSIVYPYVTVTTPDGGNSWDGCTDQYIYWSYYGTGSPTWKVEYSTNSGLLWSTLTTGTTGSSYYWSPLPNTATTSQALVRVSKTTDPLVKDSSNATFNINRVNYVVITSPNGAENWQVNNPATRNITWTYSGTNNYFDIYYSTDGGVSWNTIASSYYAGGTGNGSYTWTLPNTPSANCLVKVEDYNNSCKYDVSDVDFTITAPAPVITVSSPNGGNTYYVGGNYTISWTYQYVSGTFAKVEYSTNNGLSWTTIANSTSLGSGGNGSYTWTSVPNTPSTNCLVKVSEYNNPSVKDSSNTAFSIVYPYVVVTTPDGGNSWDGCTSQNINWSYYGTGSPTWKVDYSTNNGLSWNTLTTGTTGSSYNWSSLPNDATTTQALVRVKNNADVLVKDSSNAPFTINKVTYVIINTPNGGESWEVNNPATQNITWSYSGTNNYFNLFYSTDGGTSWNTIIEIGT